MFAIDVSHHNGSIDWSMVAHHNTKVDFAFVKATEGQTYTDPAFKMNAFYADRFGIPVSYYHFATLNTGNIVTDAEAEAKFFIHTISHAPKNTLPLALDIETNKALLARHQVLAWITRFFDVLEGNGYPDGVLYSYTAFLNENLPMGHSLGGRKLWLAAYTSGPQPKLPNGWDSYWLWQYTAKGMVLGVKGDVDCNKSDNALF